MALTQVQPGMLASDSQYTGFKNRIINGAMVIDQRNAGASVTPTVISDNYTLDRWMLQISQASKFSLQQNAGSVTPPAGFTNYLGCTSLSAYSVLSADYFTVQQRIEGYNIADLAWGTANAKTVTLSFQVYSSLTGTFGGAFKNSSSTRSYPFTYTISSANTWTQISVTVTGDTAGTWATTNGLGIILAFGLGVGSTYSGTAGAWAGANYVSATGATSVVGTSGATFYITGVQLEKGSTATSFDYRTYGTELVLCQRYFEKTYAQTEAVGASGTINSALRNYSFGDSSAQSQPVVWQFKVSKRAAPTINIYNPNDGTANQYRILETNANCSAQVIKNSSTENATVASAGAGLSSNYRFDVHLTAASEI